MHSHKIRCGVVVGFLAAAAATPCDALTHKVKGQIQRMVLDGATTKPVAVWRVRG